MNFIQFKSSTLRHQIIINMQNMNNEHWTWGTNIHGICCADLFADSMKLASLQSFKWIMSEGQCHLQKNLFDTRKLMRNLSCRQRKYASQFAYGSHWIQTEHYNFSGVSLVLILHKIIIKNYYHYVFGVQDQRIQQLLAMTMEIEKMLYLKLQ